MTDEKLDQILKQALAPEIDDSEILIKGKERKNIMKMKRIVAAGLAACAALAFVIANGTTNHLPKTDLADTTAVRDVQSVINDNIFAITAYAAELPEGTKSGDVIGLRTVEAGYGSSDYLSGRFTISGKNIEQVKVSTDKCQLYTVIPVYAVDPDYENASKARHDSREEYFAVFEDAPQGDKGTSKARLAYYDHCQIVGTAYEGTYNKRMSFGMSVPKERWSTSGDLKERYYKNIDQVNGAVITIEVSFSDGSSETHHYRMSTGKIYVPRDSSGHNQWDHLTRFLTTDEEARGNTPFSYGYLMEKMD